MALRCKADQLVQTSSKRSQPSVLEKVQAHDPSRACLATMPKKRRIHDGLHELLIKSPEPSGKAFAIGPPDSSVRSASCDLSIRTTSVTSLFSSEAASTDNTAESACKAITFSDAFSDIDWDFDPSAFPLEVDPTRGLHPTWLEPLKAVLTQPEIISLHQKLGKVYLGYDYKAGERAPLPQTEVYPAARDLYNWSRLTPLNEVKVVILGSTPLSCPGRANGLALSQSVGSRISGTMKNIHRELSNQYPERFVRPNHGSLVTWARSGVLLLNVIHTTCRDLNWAHADIGWHQFTRRVLEILDKEGGLASASPSEPQKGLVFLVWGRQAAEQIEQACIASSPRRHEILSVSATPEPNSAHNDGFFNNDHFKLANQFLQAEYGPDHEIDWCNLQAEDPL